MAESLDALKAEFFRALAHPARIRILELLVAGDLSVTELLPTVAVEASNLSQQLGVLRRAGIVRARRHGNPVIYSIASTHTVEMLAVSRTILSGLVNEQVGALERSAADT